MSERRPDPLGGWSTEGSSPALLEGSEGSDPVSGTRSEAVRRAVIADDDGPWRSLLRLLLRRCGVEVVGEAWDAEGAIEVARRTRPDLVVLDLHMPSLGGGGFNALDAIRSEHPATHIVVCSADVRHHEAVLAHGAAWAPKDGGPDALLRLIATLAGGGSPACPGP